MAQLWRELWLKTAEAGKDITTLRGILSTASNTRERHSSSSNVGTNAHETY